MSDTPKPKYSDKQVKKLLEQIHDGMVTTKNLPADLYQAISQYFTKGLYTGFGATFETAAAGDKDLLIDLRDNVHLFSAAKTYQFTKATSELLVGDDGKRKPFDQFFKEGVEVYGQYNKDWAQAEYVTTVGQAQMAKQWQSIEANKDILPILTFSTAGNPCPECEPFEDLTAPVDDPIWNMCTPLLHFRCECILIPSDDAIPSTQEHIDGLPIDENIPKDFQNNPGKSGEIFTKDHPYFEDVPEELGKNNFGLEVPEED